MKKPEVIMHNSVSLDGRINGFKVDEGLHYGIVGNYHADVYLAGSNTARTGLELYGSVPLETADDFLKPVGNKVPGIYERMDITNSPVKLQLVKSETMGNGYLWTVWKVVNSNC